VAFVNLSLIAGGLLMAVPVVLHLIMRQRPRQVVFPALRFIQQRRIANQRQLQLRHWLLLALRCAAIGLLAFALARPSVASAAMSSWIAAGLLGGGFMLAALLTTIAFTRGLSRLVTWGFFAVAMVFFQLTLLVGGRALAGRSPVMGDQEAPVAAAIVIDTSPRMQYRHDNQTRLEAAQEMAQWLIQQLPGDSELAILDSRPASGAFSVDRAAAGPPRPLVEVVSASVRLVRQKPLARKEVYVLSDLTVAAWKSSALNDLTQVLDENRDVLLYVIDVGVQRPQNFALDELRLSGDVLPQGAELTVETTLRTSGVGGERMVELQIEQPDPTLPIIRDGQPVLPKLVRRGTQSITLEPGGSQRLRFSVRGLEPGVHQGLVRLLGEDGLALDDVRFFAVEVQPAWPVLVVSPPGVSPRYLLEIEQAEIRQAGSSRFRMETLDQARLASQELGDYRLVVLVDPQPLTPGEWAKLAEFADRGGGVAVFLGHNAQPPASFQDEAAIALLGGTLTRQTRTAGDVYLAPWSYDHPVLAEFRQFDLNIPWDRFPVFYHWNLDDLIGSARTIVPFGNAKPAVVENRVGRGTVLVMTTPISDPPRPAGRPAWNELATGEDAWPNFVLVNEMLLHLVRSGQSRLNLLAGETAVLTNDPLEYPERYQLFTPLDQPQDVLSRDGRLTIRFTDNPGAYRLRGQKGGPVIRGFAVNLPADTSDLARLPRQQLDELLGKDRYQLARNQDEIDRAVGSDRIGSEFYPLLITLLAVALGLEHVLANRFYRKDD
jgi:hypothetical protein